MEEYRDYDKSAFYLPRQYLPQPDGRVRNEGLGAEGRAGGRIYDPSAAVSAEELGNPVYPPVRRLLAAHGIDCAGKTARRMTADDYDDYDLLIGMDESNLREMRRICGGDPDGKLSRADGLHRPPATGSRPVVHRRI